MCNDLYDAHHATRNTQYLSFITLMLLVTITRIPNGHRLLATSTCQGRYYCWSLYRNHTLLAVISRSYRGENSVSFDLIEPLAPGQYELRVECFRWDHLVHGDDLHQDGEGENDDEFAYHTENRMVMVI